MEVTDGRAIPAVAASTRRRRLARFIANALDTAGGQRWNADVAVEIRLQDAPLTIRRPDVVVYSADAVDVSPLRPEHVLCIVELVSRSSLTTGRIVGVQRYVRAGISHYWRIELSAAGPPIACAYSLDRVDQVYREDAICAGIVHVTEPFPVTIDLTQA